MLNKKIVFAFAACLMTTNVSGSPNKEAFDKSPSAYVQGKCDGLFAQDELIEIQYRHSPYEKVTRTINLTSKPGSERGIFSGKDKLNWAFEGRYSGDSFNFTMKKGVDIISGKAVCTEYGAIGVKQYVNKQSAIYRIMWLKKTELTNTST